MRVAVTGASGYIGSALVDALTSRGDEVVAMRRGEGPGTWDATTGRVDLDLLEGVDAVVHLAGESVGGRWIASKKAAIMDSRRTGTDAIARAVAAAMGSSGRPMALVSGSAIGFYGSRGDLELDESVGIGEGFLADVVNRWEAATGPAAEAGARVAKLRTALVLSRGGGSFPRMLLPFRLGLGGRIGSGDQYWAWITLEDQVRAMLHVLDSNIAGPVNIAAPNPVRNADFTTALGSALHRPTFMPTPTLALNVILGAEFTRETLLASQRVIPSVLTDSGFTFTHPHIDGALESIC